MPQLCDFVVDGERPRDWHLYFLRELLAHVAEEKPTERRYMKWLRERKVFDRRFIAFAERLTGIERAPQQPPALGEVARDLLDGIEKARKALEKSLEAAAGKAAGKETAKPAARAGKPALRAANPDEELDEEKAFAPKPLEPVPGDDPFVKGVLERLVELHGYLAKFVYREIGEDFLAVTELYRRMSTSAFAGRRPSLPQFEAWVKWQEWLSGLQKVGFRHKATPLGKDHGKALKDVPDSELLAPSREDDLVVEAAPAPGPAPAPPVGGGAPTGGSLVANAPTGRRTLEVDEDEDAEESDDAAAAEGLELPPAAPPPTAPAGGFWAEKVHDDAAAPRGPLPDPVLAAPAPPPAPLAAQPISSTPASPIAASPIAASSKAAYLLGWWTQAGRPGERLTARDAGLELALYRGPERGVVVFKLLALAAFLEVQPRSHGLAFFRELASRSAFEALYHEEAPLERVLDLDPARPLLYAAQLVALLRFRRALKRDGVLAKLDAAPSGRELARALRREVTGDALATGVLFVVREMARAGHWRAPGIDSLGCVPWSEAREAALRLGLLASSAASTFEDALAASEALSLHLTAAHDHEAPLRAFAAREASGGGGPLP